MQWKALAILASVTLLMQGCATMSGQECMVSDWRAVGYEDGVRGQTADRVGQHRKACAKHGITPDLDAYQAGREAGLREFCNPDNGFDLGSRGGSYRGVCPPDLADDFLAAYRSGKQLHDLETTVRSLTSQINAKRRRMDKIDNELAKAEAALVAEGTTPEERVRWLSETKSLAEERGQLETEILNLVVEKARREDELREYRARVAQNF